MEHACKGVCWLNRYLIDLELANFAFPATELRLSSRASTASLLSIVKEKLASSKAFLLAKKLSMVSPRLSAAALGNHIKLSPIMTALY